MDLKLIININKMTSFKHPLTFITIDLIKSFKLNVNCFLNLCNLNCKKSVRALNGWLKYV